MQKERKNYKPFEHFVSQRVLCQIDAEILQTIDLGKEKIISRYMMENSAIGDF